MSFFFSEKKKAANRPTVNKTKPIMQSSKETLNRLSCKACPLDKAHNQAPKMLPDLADKTDIYVLGGYPSKEDDKKGEPFRSEAGILLRSIIGRIDNVSFDNCVRDYTEYKPGQSPAIAMECCRSLITASIEQAKPKLIIGLGILPLQWMLNSSDMVGLRGRVFAVKVGNHSCYFLPTYDPEFVISTAFNKMDPLRSKLGHCLKFDIAKAKNLALDLDPPVIDTPQAVRAGIQTFNGKSPTQLPVLLKLMGWAAKAPERAIDIEGTGLKPWATNFRVLTVALSYGTTNFSFAVDHSKAGWSKDERAQIIKALKKVLAGPGRLIAHNTPFEVIVLIFLLGMESIFHDVWECTMMQSHFIDERRGKRGGTDDQFQPNPYQALDFLVKQYFGLPYKNLFKVDRKNMANADLEETLVYNGADTKYTLRLFYFQKKLLKQSGLLKAYEGAVVRQPTVALMQSIGIDIDQVENKCLEKKLSAEIKTIEKRIYGLPEVKTFVARRKAFNPASQPDVIRIFKEDIKVGKLLINDDGKETVDKGTLAKIDHPLAKDIEEFRNKSKLKSTYIDPFTLPTGEFIWPDGKMHPSCNTTFAETGRTSSDEPNNQNWPSRNDKWVRKQIVAPKGYVLVAFDFGQLEACTSAMCTKDKVLVKALWEDYDIHMEWAQKAAYVWPNFIGGIENIKDKDVMKKFRSIIKNKLVFPVIFGASNTSVAGYLNAPQDAVDKLMKEFWRTFTGLSSWQKGLMNGYYEFGFVSSPTGRRRHYPLTKNQAINHPIQSVACDIVCDAMCYLSMLAADSGNWFLHPIMNIHDDLTFCIPDKPQILEEAIECIYKAMLSPPYKFINVPLSVSCSVGTNWLEMDEVGKFWSNKDL